MTIDILSPLLVAPPFTLGEFVPPTVEQADIIMLADNIVSMLESSTALEDPVVTVERVYEGAYDLGSFTERKIDVYQLTYSDEGPADRRESYYDVRLSIVYLYRYVGDLDNNQKVPREWVDEQVTFVQNYIFNPFTDNDNRYGDGNEYWAQNLSVVAVYDFPRLTQHKVFWSEVEVTFRKLKV